MPHRYLEILEKLTIIEKDISVIISIINNNTSSLEKNTTSLDKIEISLDSWKDIAEHTKDISIALKDSKEQSKELLAYVLGRKQVPVSIFLLTLFIVVSLFFLVLTFLTKVNLDVSTGGLKIEHHLEK
jgi:Fic family protein